MQKKQKYVKKITSSIALLTSLWMPKAGAHLNFKMMKDATSFLNPGMEHYSLILGKTALESGLLRNIRFNDLSDPGFDPKTHQRVYSQDTNELNPVWTLLKALFPSTDGSLKAYAGKVTYTPKILGHLINFTYDIRSQKNSDQAIEDFLFAISKISKNDRKYFRDILGNIQKAIKQETQNTFLYPQGTTEQIILAFVCEKLNTQKESYEFMDTLRTEIVSQDQHEILKTKLNASPFQEDLLTEETIASVFQKTNDIPYTLDDVYALAHAKNFKTNLSPYIEEPGQNILIPAYDRKNNHYIHLIKFSDCLETTLRHVFNSILYIPEEGEFNVKALESLKTQQPNNAFLNSLIEFYQSMSIEQAISNGEKTHTLWNRVVGDLNNHDTPDSVKIAYVKGSSDAANPFEYELDTGMMNMVHVFQKILGVTLTPLKSEASLDGKQTWVESSLNHIFGILNPKQSYRLQFGDNMKKFEKTKDIVGQLSVVIVDKDKTKEILSFNINLSSSHGSVGNIKTLRPLSVQEKEYLDKISDYEKGLETHSTGFESKDASKKIFENLWLLNLQDSALKARFIKEKVHHPLYQLFDHKLGDAQANMKFIDHLGNLYPKWRDEKSLTEDHKKQIRKITDNIVSILALQDPTTVKIFMNAFDKLTATKGWEEVFSTEKITDLYLKEENITKLVHFKNLEKISFAKSAFSEIKFEEEMLKLKKLDLSMLRSLPYMGIEGLHHLKNLEEIEFDNYPLPNLKFEGDMLNIKKLDLSELESLPYGGIEGLHHLKNLETLSLGGNINKLKFENDLSNLKKLDLSKSLSFPEEGIQGWNHLKNLEEIKFGTYDFSTFKFDENILNVKKLDLSEVSNFSDKDIKSLYHLKSLENLSLGKDIKNLKFEEDMPNLKVLDLSNVKMMSKSSHLEGLHHLKNLEEIVFGTGFPRMLKFNEDMLNLKKLDFTNVKISNRVNIEGLHHLKNLEELNFRGNITKLNFEEDMPNLKMLDFSKIKSFPKEGIGGVNHLTALKELELSRVNDEICHMIHNMVSLENLSFLKSNIKIIEDLPESLKILKVQNCSNIKEIRLSEQNKDLILDLKNTPITRHQIKGIEFLSEDNIIGLKN